LAVVVQPRDVRSSEREIGRGEIRKAGLESTNMPPSMLTLA